MIFDKFYIIAYLSPRFYIDGTLFCVFGNSIKKKSTGFIVKIGSLKNLLKCLKT